MWRATPALAFALCSYNAVAQTKAWQDTVTLPTWVEGAPDLDPHPAAFDPNHFFYPYTARLNFGSKSEPQVWRRLNLENEYLACSFLPDLGGHLYTCTDKRNGHAMFRANPSVKKAELGPRGAWVAMGVEFNFPVVHGRDTVSPVDFGLKQEKGQAEVWVGDTDAVTGMRWLAEFILREGSAALEQNVTLSNPTAVRHPYSWWSNADIELDAGVRFVFPAGVMAFGTRSELYAWPHERGGDWSKPNTVSDALDLSAYGTRERYFGVYNATTRTATIHVAEPGAMQGMRLYHWGNANLANWRQKLSDSNTASVEIQAGLFPYQDVFEFLQPHEERQFQELWLGGLGLNGVSRANEWGILSLERTADAARPQLVAQLNVTRAVAGAKLALYKDAAAVWQEKADLSPAKTFEHALPNPESGVSYRFELRDAAGKVLLSHTEGAYEAMAASSVKLGKQPSDGPGAKRDKPGDFIEAARMDEAGSNFQLAENEYRAGLKKFPKDLQLPKALGRLLVMEGRYDDGIGNLSQAAQKLVLDPELHYYLGVAQSATNKEDDARKGWAIAQPDAQYGPPALVEWAMLESRTGHADAALKLARKAIALRPKLTAAHNLVAALLRREKQADAARQETEAALTLDPTDTAARFENVQNGGKDDDLWPHLAGDPQRVLEIAELYMHAGMWTDALAILSHPYQAGPANQAEPGATLPQDNALVSYYRGYCALKAGQDPNADWKLAATQKLNYVFPHGPEALNVLTAVLQKNPQDASATDLMGLLYLDDYRFADAAEKLQVADASNPNLPAIDYTLGRTLLLLPDKKKEALAMLHKASAADPADKNVKAAIEEANHGPTKGATAANATPANPVASMAAVAASAGGQPAKTPTSPTEIALAALDRAANGDVGGMSQFTARNFPDAKQNDVVLQAYMEMQLQVLRRDAAAKNCDDVEKRLGHLAAADPKLPLTTQPLQPLTSGARYQYFLGAVESLCGMTKEARAAWTKVTKMTPAVDSADFGFPAIAAQNLAGKNSKSVDTRGPLDKIGAALAASKDDSKGVLLYSKGILLLAAGDERAAVQAFAEGVKAPDHDLSHYLNQGALVEASHAAPVK